MTPVRTPRRVFAFAIFLAAMTPALSPATPNRAKERPTPPAEAVRKNLDQTLSLEIVEQPLELALNQLGEQAHLTIVVDRVTLAQNNVDPGSVPAPNVKLKDVKARAALRSLLAPFNLNFAVVGDTVLVSTEEILVYRQLKQRVTVDVEQVALAAALKGLARETATNLVVDGRVAKEAQAPVTLQVEDVPLETAVRLLAELAGLKPVRVGNTLFVTAKANAAALRNDPELVPNPGPRGNMAEVVNMLNAAPAGAAVPAVAPPPPPAVVPAEKPKKAPGEKEDGTPDPPGKPDGPPRVPEKP